MDFIVGPPRSDKVYDSIRVIVDRLTKVAHFIPVKTTNTSPQLAELYISKIVCIHGVPKKIVSRKDTQFTSKFCERLHESMDTKLNKRKGKTMSLSMLYLDVILCPLNLIINFLVWSQ
jgi:hypothetical protein